MAVRTLRTVLKTTWNSTNGCGVILSAAPMESMSGPWCSLNGQDSTTIGHMKSLKFLEEHRTRSADVDRCVYGLKPCSNAFPHARVKKPWRIVRVNSTLPDVFNKGCDSVH
eukprot:9740907-Lingulodinium_polyedra.AAC.1